MCAVSVSGLGLAKHAFRIHGPDETRQVLTRKQLRRAQVLKFFGRQPQCLVAMEAMTARISGAQARQALA